MNGLIEFFMPSSKPSETASRPVWPASATNWSALTAYMQGMYCCYQMPSASGTGNRDHSLQCQRTPRQILEAARFQLLTNLIGKRSQAGHLQWSSHLLHFLVHALFHGMCGILSMTSEPAQQETINAKECTKWTSWSSSYPIPCQTQRNFCSAHARVVLRHLVFWLLPGLWIGEKRFDHGIAALLRSRRA